MAGPTAWPSTEASQVGTEEDEVLCLPCEPIWFLGIPLLRVLSHYSVAALRLSTVSRVQSHQVGTVTSSIPCERVSKFGTPM